MTNLIGISGKIGSGKDTVGKIIQYLKEKDRDVLGEGQLEMSIEEYVQMKSSSHFNDTFKIKKFANKLKDIVCLVIGCAREQLEDQEFKNKELGEEWTIWKLISDPDHNLFEGVCQLNEGIFASKKDCEDFIKKEKIINVLKIEKEKLTPRKLMQLLGTEAGRYLIHPNIWVNSLMSEYKPKFPHFEYANTKNDIRTLEDKNRENSAVLNWIITDLRFPNELKAIKDRGGITIRVNRGVKLSDEFSESVFGENTSAKIEILDFSEHDSETNLDDAKFDYTIENNSTLEELVEQVREILIKEKIIK